jgi:hypothetical protein
MAPVNSTWMPSRICSNIGIDFRVLNYKIKFDEGWAKEEASPFLERLNDSRKSGNSHLNMFKNKYPEFPIQGNSGWLVLITSVFCDPLQPIAVRR